MNKGYPEDEFPVPNIDMLVGRTAVKSIFSFVDGFNGYNQILTHFWTPIGNFHYTLMRSDSRMMLPPINQPLMLFFHDMLHHFLEDNVDDIVVKSKESSIM